MAGYGKKEKDDGGAYKRLRADLKAGTPERVYVFFGEERYLLEDCVRMLRETVPEWTREFNHHVLDGKSMTMQELAEAVDALPAFADRTLTEVSDLELGKLGDEARRELVRILSDVPEHETVVFVFDTVEFKLDGRVKANQELRKLWREVEFKPQSENALVGWLNRNFAAAGKRITPEAAVRLIEMTGALMTGMKTEVEKLISYVPGDTVERRDVEAVVTPAPEAAAWELTDALLAGRSDVAMEKLALLEAMDVEAHRLSFSVSLKLRQLLTAKLCQGSGVGTKEFMKLADLRFEFQARAIYDIARKTPLGRCRELCELAAGTAYKLNSSSGDDEELIRELAVRILLLTGARR